MCVLVEGEVEFGVVIVLVELKVVVVFFVWCVFVVFDDW